MSDDQQAAPPPDPRRAAIDKIRATARWMMVAFGAIGTVLVGTAPLSNVGHLDGSSGRFWIAAAAAAIALAAIAVAIWAAAWVSAPVSRGLPDLAQNKQVRKIFNTNYEMLGGVARDLPGFVRRYEMARLDWVVAGIRRYNDPSPAHKKAERAAHERFEQFTETVKRLTSEGLLVTVRSRFQLAQLAMLGAAVVGGGAIVVFTWAANPPSPAATTTTAVAVVVKPDPLGAGALISRPAAAKLLQTHGLPAGDVLSFAGPIAVETLQPGRTLLRYSARAQGSGRFLTTSRFGSPARARVALHLPWANTAACRQTVRVVRRTLVLVGGVAFGKPGVLQYDALEQKNLAFGGVCGK